MRKRIITQWSTESVRPEALEFLFPDISTGNESHHLNDFFAATLPLVTYGDPNAPFSIPVQRDMYLKCFGPKPNSETPSEKRVLQFCTLFAILIFMPKFTSKTIEEKNAYNDQDLLRIYTENEKKVSSSQINLIKAWYLREDQSNLDKFFIFKSKLDFSLTEDAFCSYHFPRHVEIQENAQQIMTTRKLTVSAVSLESPEEKALFFANNPWLQGSVTLKYSTQLDAPTKPSELFSIVLGEDCTPEYVAAFMISLFFSNILLEPATAKLTIYRFMTAEMQVRHILNTPPEVALDFSDKEIQQHILTAFNETSDDLSILMVDLFFKDLTAQLQANNTLIASHFPLAEKKVRDSLDLNPMQQLNFFDPSMHQRMSAALNLQIFFEDFTSIPNVLEGALLNHFMAAETFVRKALNIKENDYLDFSDKNIYTMMSAAIMLQLFFQDLLATLSPLTEKEVLDNFIAAETFVRKALDNQIYDRLDFSDPTIHQNFSTALRLHLCFKNFENTALSEKEILQNAIEAETLARKELHLADNQPFHLANPIVRNKLSAAFAIYLSFKEEIMTITYADKLNIIDSFMAAENLAHQAFPENNSLNVNSADPMVQNIIRVAFIINLFFKDLTLTSEVNMLMNIECFMMAETRVREEEKTNSLNFLNASTRQAIMGWATWFGQQPSAFQIAKIMTQYNRQTKTLNFYDPDTVRELRESIGALTEIKAYPPHDLRTAFRKSIDIFQQMFPDTITAEISPQQADYINTLTEILQLLPDNKLIHGPLSTQSKIDFLMLWKERKEVTMSEEEVTAFRQNPYLSEETKQAFLDEEEANTTHTNQQKAETYFLFLQAELITKKAQHLRALIDETQKNDMWRLLVPSLNAIMAELQASRLAPEMLIKQYDDLIVFLSPFSSLPKELTFYPFQQINVMGYYAAHPLQAKKIYETGFRSCYNLVQSQLSTSKNSPENTRLAGKIIGFAVLTLLLCAVITTLAIFCPPVGIGAGLSIATLIAIKVGLVASAGIVTGVVGWGVKTGVEKAVSQTYRLSLNPHQKRVDDLRVATQKQLKKLEAIAESVPDSSEKKKSELGFSGPTFTLPSAPPSARSSARSFVTAEDEDAEIVAAALRELEKSQHPSTNPASPSASENPLHAARERHDSHNSQASTSSQEAVMRKLSQQSVDSQSTSSTLYSKPETPADERSLRDKPGIKKNASGETLLHSSSSATIEDEGIVGLRKSSSASLGLSSESSTSKGGDADIESGGETSEQKQASSLTGSHVSLSSDQKNAASLEEKNAPDTTNTLNVRRNSTSDYGTATSSDDQRSPAPRRKEYTFLQHTLDSKGKGHGLTSIKEDALPSGRNTPSPRTPDGEPEKKDRRTSKGQGLKG